MLVDLVIIYLELLSDFSNLNKFLTILRGNLKCVSYTKDSYSVQFERNPNEEDSECACFNIGNVNILHAIAIILHGGSLDLIKESIDKYVRERVLGD